MGTKEEFLSKLRTKIRNDLQNLDKKYDEPAFIEFLLEPVARATSPMMETSNLNKTLKDTVAIKWQKFLNQRTVEQKAKYKRILTEKHTLYWEHGKDNYIEFLFSIMTTSSKEREIDEVIMNSKCKVPPYWFEFLEKSMDRELLQRAEKIRTDPLFGAYLDHKKKTVESTKERLKRSQDEREQKFLNSELSYIVALEKGFYDLIRKQLYLKLSNPPLINLFDWLERDILAHRKAKEQLVARQHQEANEQTARQKAQAAEEEAKRKANAKEKIIRGRSNKTHNPHPSPPSAIGNNVYPTPQPQFHLNVINQDVQRNVLQPMTNIPANNASFFTFNLNQGQFNQRGTHHSQIQAQEPHGAQNYQYQPSYGEYPQQGHYAVQNHNQAPFQQNEFVQQHFPSNTQHQQTTESHFISGQTFPSAARETLNANQSQIQIKTTAYTSPETQIQIFTRSSNQAQTKNTQPKPSPPPRKRNSQKKSSESTVQKQLQQLPTLSNNHLQPQPSSQPQTQKGRTSQQPTGLEFNNNEQTIIKVNQNRNYDKERKVMKKERFDFAFVSEMNINESFDRGLGEISKRLKYPFGSYDRINNFMESLREELDENDLEEKVEKKVKINPPVGNEVNHLSLQEIQYSKLHPLELEIEEVKKDPQFEVEEKRNNLNPQAIDIIVYKRTNDLGRHNDNIVITILKDTESNIKIKDIVHSSDFYFRNKSQLNSAILRGKVTEILKLWLEFLEKGDAEIGSKVTDFDEIFG